MIKEKHAYFPAIICVDDACPGSYVVKECQTRPGRDSAILSVRYLYS
jgi:hypothetical protein